MIFLSLYTIPSRVKAAIYCWCQSKYMKPFHKNTKDFPCQLVQIVWTINSLTHPPKQQHVLVSWLMWCRKLDRIAWNVWKLRKLQVSVGPDDQSLRQSHWYCSHKIFDNPKSYWIGEVSPEICWLLRVPRYPSTILKWGGQAHSLAEPHRWINPKALQKVIELDKPCLTFTFTSIS